jgi:hypothetical protein
MITAPDALDRIAQAVAAGPVFGRHYHFAGGRSGDTWAFQTFEAYQNYLARSKPGDLYQVWSLPALLHQQVALMVVQFGTRSDAEMISLVEQGLWTVKTYLDVPYNEFLALYLWAGTLAIEVYLNDIDGFDELLEDVDRYSRPGGEIYVFPFTRIGTEEYILLQGKYPNAEGKVPIGGAY